MKKRIIAAVATTLLLTACLDTIENVDYTCSTEALDDGSGAKIVCNGDSIGVVLNGIDGTNGKNGKNGVDGSSCEMQPLKKADGFKIVCDGDSVGVLFNGIDGKDGKDGKDARNCVVVDTLDAATGRIGVSFECDGEDPVVVWSGKDGENGKDGVSCTTKENATGDGYDVICDGKKVGELRDGKDGENGKNGSVCTTKENAAGNGYDVICDGKTVGELRNGKDGENGKDGVSCITKENAAGDGYDVICDGKTVGELRNGKDGISCITKENATGDGYEVICDGKKVGDLHNGKDGLDASCIVTIEEDNVVFNCGATKTSIYMGILNGRCNTIRTTKDDFIPLENVIPCLAENEKVAFIVRHAERPEDKYGKEDGLNGNGIAQSKDLGKKLAGFPDFYYMHTNVVRTMETANYVAEGKGQIVEKFTEDNSDFETHELNEDLYDSWYVKNSEINNGCSNNSWENISKMAYETDNYDCKQVYYNVKERSEELVKKHFTYEKMHDITFAVSHDKFIAPFLVAVTDGNIGFDYYRRGTQYYWPNYLAGVAIIVDDKDNVTYVPVKGLGSGRLGNK